MKYELINCRPVPKRVAAEVRVIGVTITSCLRTQAAVSYARARGCSLSSQAELRAAYLRGQGNPANPVGFSTHELRSDGVAYGWVPRGYRLPFSWMVGIDNADSPTFIARARGRGWMATLTYPTSSAERHHVNFRKEPRYNPFPVLKRGKKGRRVRRLTRRLCFVEKPRTNRPYMRHSRRKFDATVETALRKYQRDHHLKPDGIYGRRTHKQLMVSVRRERLRRREGRAWEEAKRLRELVELFRDKLREYRANREADERDPDRERYLIRRRGQAKKRSRQQTEKAKRLRRKRKGRG